jgi:hypothetical protein
MTLAPADALIRTQVGPRNAWTNEEGLRHYRWEGKDYPSVTTIRRLAGLPFGLHNWALSQVANRAVDRYAELGQIMGNGPEGGKAAVTWLRGAATEKRDIAAKLGTAVHDAAAAGKLLTEVGDDVAPFLRQYQDWLVKSQAHIIAAEKQVWNLKIGYAGTFDLLCQLPDGGIRLIDLKTGKGLYPEHALQAMAYAMAQFVGHDDIIDERLTRLLRRTNAIGILHLAREGWEYVELKLVDEDGNQTDLWPAFRGLLTFAVWMEANKSIEPLVSVRIAGAA